ncbi:calcium-binding protein [Sulfurovum mangrovi]|uniref:calcium-binding protein n=1 Tax=Sulfurovum mangrovi TaxID=2893889 RepID=UPI001E4475C1|nr:hypothetical protein [Sulfurovum mangrovi]UFH59162.1 hypothetical protein LN246_12570 [Sulfurovum mangrovi]
MGREVIIHINNSEKTIEVHHVKTHAAHPSLAGNAVHIKAHSNVKYLLSEKGSGYAPENIIVKRVGKDLHIAFEGNGIDDPDLIIEGYYDQSEVSVVGQAENGLYYLYIPESAELSDALSGLENGRSSGQALGGEGFSSPLAEEGGISTLTLVGAILGVGAVAGLAGGGGGGSGSDATVPDPSEPEPSDDGSISREDFESEYDGAIQEGGPLGDTLLGTNDPDRLYGFGGEDLLTGLDGDDLLDGGEGDDDLYGGAGRDLLIGGSGADFIYGGTGDDIIFYDLLDTVDGGAGYDTLYLEGGGVELDLADNNFTIGDIEHIDITGSGDNKLVVSYQDILDLSNESDTLFVTGNSGDTVHLYGEEVFVASVTVDGVTYDTYDLGGTGAADIWVEQGLTVI